MIENFRDKLIHARHADGSQERETLQNRNSAAQRQATPAPSGPSSPDHRRVVKLPPEVETFPPELRKYFAKMAQDRSKA